MGADPREWPAVAQARWHFGSVVPVPGIFLRRDEGEFVHLRGELYESEDQLQELLEANPELLFGESAESDRPSRYLLVRREAGVPEADGGSDRWFLDHLFLD